MAYGMVSHSKMGTKMKVQRLNIWDMKRMPTKYIKSPPLSEEEVHWRGACRPNDPEDCLYSEGESQPSSPPPTNRPQNPRTQFMRALIRGIQLKTWVMGHSEWSCDLSVVTLPGWLLGPLAERLLMICMVAQQMVMCWWLTDAEKMSLSHLTEKFFMLFLVAPVNTLHS